MRTFDVVVPCYNYSRYLRACVHSVLSQRDVKVRVLIVDDASTDDSARTGQELAACHSAVEFRRHEINRGHIATYNEGLIEWSSAEYTVLLSADDMLAPGCLSRAARIMEANENIGMVYGRAIHFEREADLLGISTRERGHTRFSGDEWLEARCRAGHNVISSPEVVVRGSVQRAVGGYRPELPHAGDLEMWLRIAAVADIAYVRDVPQAFYRVHTASMLRTKYRDGLLDLHQRKLAFDSFFQRHHHTVANVNRLRELANCALAREALWDACRAYDRNQVQEARAHELIEFAMTTYHKTVSLSEYAALRRRRFFGPFICNRTQLFAAPALVRKVRRSLKTRRWRRRGT